MTTAMPKEIEDFWLRGVLTPELGESCVTQAELRRLRQLKLLQSEYEQLRQRVRAKVLGGAVQEAGELTVIVTESMQHKFSFENIASLLGESEARRLKALVAPAHVVRLEIVHSTEAKL